MISQDNNYFDNHKIRREPSHAPRTPWDRETKLLADAQRTAKATSKQRPSRLLPEGEDCRDLTIKLLQAQLVEMTQIMVENQLMKPPLLDGEGPSRARSGVQRDPPHESRKEK